MGVGDSLEARYPLPGGAIPAGTWHLVGDGIVFASADITYQVIWRHDGSDSVLVEWTHHFDPPGSGFGAIPFEADGAGIAADTRAGDLLVLRFSASGAGTPGRMAFIPNGDGAGAGGRIPSIKLP